MPAQCVRAMPCRQCERPGLWEEWCLGKKLCGNLPRTTIDTTTYMIPSPKTCGNLPKTTIDRTTYMIHPPKRVATSQGPQSTRQLTWPIAQNVWQPPKNHNRQDNLHDPSPKTCGNLPKTTIDTTTYMIHRPKRVATSQGPQSTGQLPWSIAQNVWQPPKNHNRQDNLHNPSPKMCGNPPKTTIDRTTYMIHPKDHNWHDNLHDPSQGPQSTRQLTWSIAQNVWQPPKDQNRMEVRTPIAIAIWGKKLLRNFPTSSMVAFGVRSVTSITFT